MQLDIKIQSSRGRSGKIVKYVRPIHECINKSRRVTGWTSQEVNDKIEKVIDKWYAPRVILYEIEGHIIGSNCKENALKEYWKRCELKDIGKLFEIKQYVAH